MIVIIPCTTPLLLSWVKVLRDKIEGRDRQRQTYIQTDRYRQTETDRQRQTKTKTQREREHG